MKIELAINLKTAIAVPTRRQRGDFRVGVTGRFASPRSLFGGLGNPQTRTASPKPAIAGLPDLMALLASQVQSL